MRKKVIEEKVSHLREVETSGTVMPRHCSAGGCKSRDNRQSRNAGITFHKLPKGPTRRNLWITNSRRADSWDPQSDFVYFCSKHFTPESFELTGYSGIRRLREDAFPTVFDSSAKTKSKRAARLQKRGDAPVRKSRRLDDQETTEQQKDESEAAGEPAGERSAPAETPEDAPQESPEVERLSQDEHSPPPEPETRPVSPSRYMRRLPPPPGFYLSKEHSYAQLCPLLWRRRYDQAIECLEKALRQLHAARRRESRLRSTVLRLRDKRMKQPPPVSKERRSPGEETRRGRGGRNLENDAASFEDRGGDQTEFGGRFLQSTNSWCEEDRGQCFYCGRGQGQDAGGVSQSGGEGLQDSHRTRRTAEKVTKMQTDVSVNSPGTSVESRSSDTDATVLLRTQPAPPGASTPDVHEQFLGADGDPEAQQLFWIQDCSEGSVVLVPVLPEDGAPHVLKKVGGGDVSQTFLLSETDLRGDFGNLAESGAGVCADGELGEHALINPKEDVREKLKKHLEGFHLQLSTEFLT